VFLHQISEPNLIPMDRKIIVFCFNGIVLFIIMSNINNSIIDNIIDIANGYNDNNSHTADAGTPAANVNDLELLESEINNAKGYTKVVVGLQRQKTC
jgi:hypothetical protein